MKTANEILSLDDRPVFDVEIPEWGITAKVRELDVATMAKISKSCADDTGKIDDLDMAVKVIVEGSVEPKFGPEHVETLKAKSNAAVNRLFKSIMAGKKK